jgi:phosphoglycolate phosphatase-like HAD superfamily hydrolase
MSYVLLFDVDGTITDILDPAFIALNQLADKFHYQPLQNAASLREWDWRDVPYKLGISRFKWRKFMREWRTATKEACKQLPIVDKLTDIFNILLMSGVKLAALTKASLTDFSQLAGVNDRFTLVDEGDYVNNKEKALKDFLWNFQLEPDDVVYIGDEIQDIEAAKKLKMRSVAASWGVNHFNVLLQTEPDFIISKPGELLTVVSQLG